MRTSIGKTEEVLRSVWHEVEYFLVVCRTTNGAHAELVQGVKGHV
jgi:hypothetical protein